MRFSNLLLGFHNSQGSSPDNHLDSCLFPSGFVKQEKEELAKKLIQGDGRSLLGFFLKGKTSRKALCCFLGSPCISLKGDFC